MTDIMGQKEKDIPVLEAENVSYSYRTKYQTIRALREVSCRFEASKMYAVVGESGSGKSTLLSLLAGLDVPESGTVYVQGEDLAEKNRDRYRRDMACVVYQAFHLFPLLTALENVMYPMELKGVPKRQAQMRAKEILLEMGLGEKIFRQFPQMMSGGEQQRVAIARALAAGGKILLADEPTGNLDSKTSQDVLSLLKVTSRKFAQTIVMITHNEEISQMADRIIRIEDGKIVTRGVGMRRMTDAESR